MTAAAPSRLETVECALAEVVHENGELRASVGRIRSYVSLLRDIAREYRESGVTYMAEIYDEFANGIEHQIGGRT